MESQENAFKMFLKSFQNMGGQFQILENRVPFPQQLEYLNYSRKLRKRKYKIKEADYRQYREKLENVELTKDEKKKILTILALSAEVHAYRLLEQYMQQPDKELENWASMALMESRIAIESELSGERQIYISSGLGGKMGKMRFYVFIPSLNGLLFEDYQRKVIEKEFDYLLPKKDCEMERLTIKDNYMELVFLIPITTDVRKILKMAIMECNVYGNFLSQTFTVTNVKEFSQDEINQILTRNSKAIEQI